MKTKTNIKWVVQIVLISMSASMVFTLASAEVLGNAGYAMAFVVLMVFILLGIIFDVIGVSVTAAQEAPFHSMAAHRERGAAEAIRLMKNADKVSSFCNDVVGDVSGIVSGATAALVTARLMTDLRTSNIFLQLAVSGVVTGMIIGGKAVGKTFAMNNSTQIVLKVGKLINLFKKRS